MTTPYDDSTTSIDSDGDGWTDTFAHDLDGDGLIDTVAVVDVATGAVAVALDTDGDGEVDTILVDNDGDGYADDGWTEPGTEAATTSPGDDPYDPTVTDPYAVDDPFVTAGADLPDTGDEGLHGDPRGDMQYHTVQPGPVDCLPTSVSMIVSEVTGQTVSADELADLADEKGYLNAGGMSAEDSLDLLQSYGVDAELQTGTVDGLRTALDNGDQIIIGLDSADLYQGDGGPFDPGMTAGHAVVITGIDDGPPAYAYINDPGFPDGAGVQVPLELFEDAWADSDHTMVVVEGTTPDTTEPSDDTTSVPADGADDATTDTSSTDSTSTDSSDDGTEVVAAGTGNAATRLLLLPITLTTDALSNLGT